MEFNEIYIEYTSYDHGVVMHDHGVVMHVNVHWDVIHN